MYAEGYDREMIYFTIVLLRTGCMRFILRSYLLRPMMIDIGYDWCPFGGEMTQVLSQYRYKSNINHSFITIIIGWCDAIDYY